MLIATLEFVIERYRPDIFTIQRTRLNIFSNNVFISFFILKMFSNSNLCFKYINLQKKKKKFNLYIKRMNGFIYLFYNISLIF